MNVTEQAGAAFGNWADMQKRMWDEWYGMLTSAATMRAPGAEGGPAAALKQGAEALSQGTNEAARALMEKMQASQGAMNRVMDFFLKSWKVVAPSLDAGKDWRPDLQRFASDWAQEATAMMNRNLGLGSNVGDMTRSMVQDWPSALGPWFGFLSQASSIGHLGEAALGGTSGLTRLLNMGTEVHPLPGLGELPRFGVSREKNAKMLRLFDATVDLRKSSFKFHSAFAQGLAKAVEATVEQLGELAQKGEKITSVRDLMRLWYKTADGSLMHTFNSPEFIDIQNEFTTAGLTLKIRQREVLEDMLRALDMPTRSELDDAYKVIHELKKEIRAIKKAHSEGEREAAIKSRSAGSRASSARGQAKAG